MLGQTTTKRPVSQLQTANFSMDGRLRKEYTGRKKCTKQLLVSILSVQLNAKKVKQICPLQELQPSSKTYYEIKFKMKNGETVYISSTSCLQDRRKIKANKLSVIGNFETSSVRLCFCPPVPPSKLAHYLFSV